MCCCVLVVFSGLFERCDCGLRRSLLSVSLVRFVRRVNCGLCGVKMRFVRVFGLIEIYVRGIEG